MFDVKGDNHQSPNHNFFVSGVPNDGFLVNTLKTLFTQLRVLRSLKMHSKRRYKICICSVIVEEQETFRNYFPENFRCNFTYYESENFSVPSLLAFLNSKIEGFLFSTKKSLTLGMKCEKLNFRKS